MLLHRELTKEELAAEAAYNARHTESREGELEEVALDEEADVEHDDDYMPAPVQPATDRREIVLDLLSDIKNLVPKRVSFAVPLEQPAIQTEPVQSAAVLPPKDKEEMVEWEDGPTIAATAATTAAATIVTPTVTAASDPTQQLLEPEPVKAQDMEPIQAPEKQAARKSAGQASTSTRASRSRAQASTDKITGATLRDGELVVDVQRANQSRRLEVLFSEIADSRKWEWLRAFLDEGSSTSLWYPDVKRAVVQALASDRSSVSGGDAQMLNLVVPGGDCRDGATVKEPSLAVQQQAQDDQIRNNEEFSRDVIITPAAETESIIIAKTAEKQAKMASACS